MTSLAARVRAGGAGIRPRTHMLLRVEFPAGALVADVGFGGDGPLRPLPLDEGSELWAGSAGHRLRRDEGVWVLEGNVTAEWSDLYAFSLEPHYPVDFEMANHFTSTYPRARPSSRASPRSASGRRRGPSYATGTSPSLRLAPATAKRSAIPTIFSRYWMSTSDYRSRRERAS